MASLDVGQVQRTVYRSGKVPEQSKPIGPPSVGAGCEKKWKVMRILSYLLALLLGAGLVYLFTSFDAISGPSVVRASESGATLNITYADFLSVMLTVVTIVLAALAIGVGLLAFRTVKEIKTDARSAVKSEVDNAMEGVKNTIEQTVAQMMFRTGHGAREQGELEPEFDPTDTGDR